MSGVRGMKTRAYDGARRKGVEAARMGKPESACPYADHRTDRGTITYSRAFMRAWFDGYRSVKKERTK